MKKILHKDAYNNTLLWWTFTLYIVILIWVIMFKANIFHLIDQMSYIKDLPLSERISTRYLIPCYSIFESIRYNNHFNFRGHFYNVIAFVPLGIFLQHFIRKKTYLTSGIIILASTLIFEFTQLFSGIGCFDTTDILTNALGGILGMLLYKHVLSKAIKTSVNLASFITNIIITPLAMYAIVNTILHFDVYL